MRAVGEADRARGARDLLHRHAVLEVAESQPAIFLRGGDPVQAERPHFRPQIAGKKIVAVDCGGARRDLLLREGSRALADHLGALAEVELERAGGVGDHGGLRAGGCGRRTLGAFGDAGKGGADAMKLHPIAALSPRFENFQGVRGRFIAALEIAP
jgi:hypothetical protein